MQRAGLVLIIIGFIAGCLASVLDPDTIELRLFVPAFLLGLVGVILVQVGRRRTAQDAGRLATDLEAIGESLAQIVAEATALDETKQIETVYELPDAIDEKFPKAIQRFVEARESIMTRHGVQAYADIMSAFAAGERYLNRVWSAAAEGYVDEAHIYIGKARAQFESALNTYRQFSSSARLS